MDHYQLLVHTQVLHAAQLPFAAAHPVAGNPLASVWEVGHEVNCVVWSQKGLAFVASDALLGIFHQAKVSRGITHGSDWKNREATLL